MKVTAVVVAAGKGIRMGTAEKILASLCGKSLIAYVLEALNKFFVINEIIVVVSRLNCEKVKREIKRKSLLSKVSQIVIGGATRTDSVYKGLKKVDPETDFVLIHDAARPFIDSKMVTTAVREASHFGAAVTGVPVTSTIKIVKKNLFVDSTLIREELWEIQTPQVFKRQLIVEAYNQARLKGIKATDDANLVEMLGHRVKIVEGSDNNIKITTPQDLRVAEAILKTM